MSDYGDDGDVGGGGIEEPVYEEEEVFDEDELEPEVPEGDDDYNRRGAEEEENVVISGDPSATANRGGKATNDKSHKDKKIPNEERSTTKYMTKYEKARILGTRALQIRQAKTFASLET
ncbi:hypothetical protein F5X99DRAFT_378092 [Biscogniauxia marginata]|nr:hypothetical protein F5X99DRAFT_378092 [Biscogniauxia marginata]